MATAVPPFAPDRSASSGKRQRLKEELKSTSDDIEGKRLQLHKAQDKLSWTEAQLRKSQENFSTTRALLERYNALLLRFLEEEKAERQKKEAKAERDTAKAERDKAEAQVEELKAERDEAEAQVERLTKELEVLENQRSSTQRLVYGLDPDAHEYFQAIANLGAPSGLCSHHEWWKAQAGARESSINKPLFLCSVPPGAQPGMPVELVEEAFSQFLVNAKNATVDQGDCAFIEDLCNLVCRKLMSDKEMAGEFRVLLKDYLGPGYDVVPTSITCQKVKSLFPTDGCVMVAGRMALLAELKLEPKTTLFQAMHYYAIHVAHLMETGNEQSFFPCFLIELVGTCIRISGLVYIEKVACQPLTPFLHCYINNFDCSNMNTLARAMHALRTGVHKLKNMNSAALKRNKNIPYCLCSPALEFQKRIPGKLMFVMKEKDTEKFKVVKFCRQYGVSVHEAWAEKGLAPQLFNQDKRPDGWYVIEMEYLHPDEWKSVYQWSTNTSQTLISKAQLQRSIDEALTKAHEIRINGRETAHGDMRSPNIMVRETGEVGQASCEVKFTDFDWSGIVEDTLYPTFMNMDLEWDEDVGPGKPLRQKHDVHCVKAL